MEGDFRENVPGERVSGKFCDFLINGKMKALPVYRTKSGKLVGYDRIQEDVYEVQRENDLKP